MPLNKGKSVSNALPLERLSQLKLNRGSGLSSPDQPFNLETFEGCILYLSSDIVNPTLAYFISWDSELVDTGGFHESVTNPTRVTIPAGVSKIQLNATLEVSGLNGSADFSVSFRKNGGNEFVGESTVISDAGGLSTGYLTLTSSYLAVSENDYFELRINCTDSTLTLKSQTSSMSLRVIE